MNLPQDKKDRIDALLHNIAVSPTEHNLKTIEDYLKETIPKVDEQSQLYLWRSYFTAIKVYINYGR